MNNFRYPILVAAGSALLAGFSTNAIGQSTVIKQDTASMAANAINWSATPGTTDYGSFGSALSTANAAALDLGGNLTLGRLIFTNASNGPLVITNSGTLTLGNAVAIDARFSNQSITIHAPIVINTAGNTFEADNSLSTTLTFTNTITSTQKIIWRAGTGIFSGGGSYTAMDIGSRSGILSTVRLGADNGLAANAALTIGTANGSAQFDLAGFNQTLAGITKGGQPATIGNSSTTFDSVLTITGTSTFEGLMQDVIGSGSRKLGLTVDGGVLTLKSANTYSGATTINSGTLMVGAEAGGQALGNNSAVTVANVAGATLDLNNFNQTIGSLAGGGTTGGSVILGSATLTTGGNNASTVYAGIISGTGTLTKVGTGTMSITSAVTYTGGTFVDEGVLWINSTNASNAVTVAAGVLTGTPVATIGGHGTIAGTLTLTGETSAGFKNGGVLAPGTNGEFKIGTLTAGTTTWNGGSVWKFDLAPGGTVSDQLAITGNFTKGTGSGFVFDFMGSIPEWNKTFTLVTWTGSTTFSLSDFDLAGSLATLGTGPYSTSFFTLNTTDGTLQFTAIPEPTTALAGLLLGLGLLRHRARNRPHLVPRHFPS